MSGHGAPHIEVPAKRPRPDDGRSGTSMEKRTPKGWISYGEILTAVIEGRSLGIQDIFHDRGRHQSKAYWESQASEQGCHLKIRGRKRGNNNVFRTVIVITGPQGCTRPFYKRFREFLGRSLESFRGLALPDQVYVREQCLEGVTLPNGQVMADPKSAPELAPQTDDEGGDTLEVPADDDQLTHETRSIARNALLSGAPKGKDLRSREEGNALSYGIAPVPRDRATVAPPDELCCLAEKAWKALQACPAHALLSLPSFNFRR